MKSSLKTVLAAALIALSIASCTKKGGETTTAPVDTVQTPVDTTQVGVDTTGTAGDTTAH